MGSIQKPEDQKPEEQITTTTGELGKLFASLQEQTFEGHFVGMEKNKVGSLPSAVSNMQIEI